MSAGGFPSHSFMLRLPSVSQPITPTQEEQIHNLLSGRTVLTEQLPTTSFQQHTTTRRMKVNHETVPYPLAWSLVTATTTNQAQYSSSTQLSTMNQSNQQLERYVDSSYNYPSASTSAPIHPNSHAGAAGGAVGLRPKFTRPIRIRPQPDRRTIEEQLLA